MFPSRNRLKDKHQIVEALKNGEKRRLGDFLFVFRPGQGELRFLSIVKKRDVRSAVDRNRIRRVIGELVRQNIPYQEIKGDLLIISYRDSSEDIGRLFLEALKRWQEKR